MRLFRTSEFRISTGYRLLTTGYPYSEFRLLNSPLLTFRFPLLLDLTYHNPHFSELVRIL